MMCDAYGRPVLHRIEPLVKKYYHIETDLSERMRF